MNRPWQANINDSIIERLKAALPNAVLRTTLIVGFPGETEVHFQHLCDFIQRHEFDHVGVFTFSPEEGTAAYDLPNPIPQDVMDSRRDRLMALQQPISLRQNRQSIGKTVQVLIEQENPGTGQLIGRSDRFSPDVDGLVYIDPTPDDPEWGSAALGTMALVKIIDADPYDLYGHLVTVRDLLCQPQPVTV
jgi:ribosomal protein S12 methylthiotransferase